MPKELIEDANLKESVALYHQKIGREAYQPLSELLTKLKNIWTSNSTISQEAHS